MKKTVLAAAVAAAALLGLAPPASAKEVSFSQVCGTSGCKAVKPDVVVSHDGGFRPAAAPMIGSYYVLRVGYGDGRKIFERGEQYFVPQAGAVVGKDVPGPTDGWLGLPDKAAATLRAAAAGLKPFPAPTPSRFYIGTHRSADPAAYAALLGPLEKTTVPRTGESLIPIGLEWPASNPWSSDAALLYYLAGAKVLSRLDGYYRVPSSIAERLDRERRGLSPVAPDSFPWGALGGGLGGLVTVLSAAALALRRRRRNQ